MKNFPCLVKCDKIIESGMHANVSKCLLALSSCAEIRHKDFQKIIVIMSYIYAEDMFYCKFSKIALVYHMHIYCTKNRIKIHPVMNFLVYLLIFYSLCSFIIAINNLLNDITDDLICHINVHI